MCTVQVLLFADVMGRTNSVQGVRSGAGVCRRLFANDPSERADPSVFLKRMEDQLRQRDKERWNFDFQTETPLAGRYQWMPVSAPAPKKDKTIAVAEASPAQSTSSSMQASKRKRSNTSTQPKITEFMTKRKRSSSEEGTAHKLKVRRLSRTSSSSDHLIATTRPR
ncbi:cyclin-dependent kinase inhibitor 1B-like [Argiope bruennichi]|uniref:Cyclin-dependent kinase inhibitor 1B like protein n=1 Tax=Argiope bruennichi TaxID=94029 RepID=A0A8T0ECG9_ARGBR|nr:cyclin-dependent kinase inhibitor 1B-like [Argiope bruennichi]KAF8770323.1 Cyclin-dependent kinase inhibitor 1B like protein [Argiope bruennichi]